jgi:hypothetical protein
MTAVRNLRDVSYKPPAESKKGISVRLPLSLLTKLDEVVDIWKSQAAARKAAGGIDDASAVDRSHVIVTLLESAVAAEFDLYGGRPVDADSWERLRAAIKAGVEKVNKNTKK